MRNLIAKLLIPVFFLGLMLSCNSSKKTDNTDQGVSPDLVTNPITASGEKTKSSLPVMEFETEKHDFGLIMDGEKVSHTFKYKNIGGSDLVISSVSATCGCTTPRFSKKPIKAGESGSIEVFFNSTNRPGPNHKGIKVLTNAQPNTIELTITAEVFSPEK
ncbi:MAG: DUF1573 domain-containing protein [Bacteroidetes bacterium]|nr:DUF1573 domain-containing protein [Bacteroidota bacterium]